MKFCSKCGTGMEDDMRFCPSCGAPAQDSSNTNVNGQTAATQDQSGNQNYYRGNYNYQGNSFFDTKESTNMFHPQDIADNKVLAVLSYLGFLWLIPMFAGKQSPFVRYHVKQGFVLFVLEICSWLLESILGLCFGTAFLFFGMHSLPWGIAIIFRLINLCILAFSIYGIVMSASGRAKEVPFTGKLAKYFTFIQ